MGVPLLGWEDPLEKEMATYSSILTWEIPWTEEPGGLWSVGSQELDVTEWLNHHAYITHFFFNPLICWWALTLFLSLVCHESCCSEYGSADTSLRVFILFPLCIYALIYVCICISRRGITRSCVSPIFIFLRNLHTVWHSGWNNSHFHQ